MACYGDLWRFPASAAYKDYIPEYWWHRIRNDGLIANSIDKDFMCEVYHSPVDLWVKIPCGQCLGCRLDYSRMWADRCMLEASLYEHNCFLTLTYSDDNLPYADTLDRFSGSLENRPILVKKHFQDFMKRLKANLNYLKPGYGDGVRVYYCGEYGSQTLRPHFHAILFNCDFSDKLFWKMKNGNRLYNSAFLDNAWKHGYGVIGDVTWESCAYVARYVMKKQIGFEKKAYDEAFEKLSLSDLKDLSYMPGEFVGMSRRPGIARQYYDEHRDEIYALDKIVLPANKGNVRQARPGRYYDSIYDIEKPDEFAQLKALRRHKAKDNMKLQLSRTDLSELEYNAVREQKAQRRVKKLLRTDI